MKQNIHFIEPKPERRKQLFSKSIFSILKRLHFEGIGR